MLVLNNKLQFYIHDLGFRWMPTRVEQYWEWYLDHEALIKPRGRFNWTLQTYLQTKDFLVDSELVFELPDSGIVISHSDFLPDNLEASPKRYVVEIKPDRVLKCQNANELVIQNANDPYAQSFWKRSIFSSSFMPLWPQPSLIARKEERGNQLENVAFMGNPREFRFEFSTMTKRLAELGFNWVVKESVDWNQYGDVDVIVAIRSERSHQEMKPPSKLYNAWLAGVPAILSADSAFEAIRSSELDYLTAETEEEVVDALKLLKNQPELVRKMVENGRKRSAEFSVESTRKRWIELIKAIDLRASNWRSSHFRRSCFTAKRGLLKLKSVLR